MTDKEKISKLKNLVEILCDNVSDQPSGCDACWLWENGNCGKEVLYEKMKAENQKPCDKYIKEIDHLRRYISKLETQIAEQEPQARQCKKCKYFEYDSAVNVDGIPLIVAHEICSRWGNGCKTSEDGYCFLFESQESEDKDE